VGACTGRQILDLVRLGRDTDIEGRDRATKKQIDTADNKNSKRSLVAQLVKYKGNTDFVKNHFVKNYFVKNQFVKNHFVKKRYVKNNKDDQKKW